ncbi:MAG: hypothetical protein SPD47_03320 [Oscillospiraceae bacterium]|nr:hypothetical protein [Oscillospiraceae bacterium]
MEMRAFFTAVLLLISGCTPTSKASRSTVCEYGVEELTLTGYCTEYGNDGNDVLYYSGEITGDTAVELYGLITEQYSQAELHGGNYLKCEPYLTLTAPDGTEFTCCYTWDSEEDIVDELGEPGTAFVGECFLVVGRNSRKFAPMSDDAGKRFSQLITDYLTENYTPSKKKAGTENIVFVERRTNYAWGKTDNVCFIDSCGNLYSFDLSDRTLGSEREFFEALTELYAENEPTLYDICDSERMREILTVDIPEINLSSEVTERSVGADMGQRTLYAVTGDGRLIMLRSEGDWIRTRNDPMAERLCAFYDMIR